jgi:tetratricopeptide (TPR) repeat protein
MADGEDFWTYGRKSEWSAVRTYVYLGILIGTFFWADTYWLPSLGLPVVDLSGWAFWLLPLEQLITVTVHELGHAAVALSLGFRFRSLNIGPVTIRKEAGGHRHFRFDFSRLLTAGGYMGAVPDSDVHVRSREIMVVFAGPLASLLGAFSMASLCLNAKGTAWEIYWHWGALLGALFLADFFTSLLPIGYSDGTILLHLILWTERGRNFYSRIRTATVWDDADLKNRESSPAQEVELRRQALEQVLARGGASGPQLAQAYRALASAEFRLHRLADAEQHFTESLRLIDSCRGVNPALEADCWSGLYRVLRIRQRASEAERAYDAAVMGFERAKESVKSGAERAQIHLSLAGVHKNQGHYELALREAEAGLAHLPHDAKYLLGRVELILVCTKCEFERGAADRGREAADRAEALLRSEQMPEIDRNRACQRLGALGIKLWHAGRDARAASLLLEAAALCEARGLARDGTGFRLMAIAVLRRSGRLREAEAAFPGEAEPDADGMRRFLDERAELHLAMGRVTEAVADFEEALKQARKAAEPDPIKVAQSEVWLAAGYLAAGRIGDAEAMARNACDVLYASGHPDEAGALVTLALIAWGRGEETARSHFDRAMRLIADSPFVERVNKAYFFERAAQRLNAVGRFAEAHEARAAAAEHWRFLGIEKEDAVPAGVELDFAAPKLTAPRR